MCDLSAHNILINVQITRVWDFYDAVVRWGRISIHCIWTEGHMIYHADGSLFQQYCIFGMQQ